MGMYDHILAHESLIHPLIDEYGFELEMSKSKEYFDFQTKDLDNSLTCFFIDKDGSFYWEKLHQEYVEPTEQEKKEKKFAFGHWKQIAPPEKIVDTRTTYIEFYDLFAFQDERIFITFLAHIKNGKLAEPISIKSIERTDLTKEKEELKIHREKWEKVRATWQWRLCDFCGKVKWKINKFFLPLLNYFDNLGKNLRKQAKKKFLDEKDIGNW